MRRNYRNKRIVVPLGQSDHYQHQHRQQNEKLEHGGKFSHHLNAAHVDVSDDSNDGERNDVMPPSREFGKIEAHVVGELHRVNAAQQK